MSKGETAWVWPTHRAPQNEVPGICQLSYVELYSTLTNLNLRREETHQDHCRLTRSRPQEAKGAQCTKADHSVKRMKTHVELNSTTPNRGNIKEEGEDGSLNHALYDKRVESPEGTCTTLDQS